MFLSNNSTPGSKSAWVLARLLHGAWHRGSTPRAGYDMYTTERVVPQEVIQRQSSGATKVSGPRPPSYQDRREVTSKTLSPLPQDLCQEVSAFAKSAREPRGLQCKNDVKGSRNS